MTSIAYTARDATCAGSTPPNLWADADRCYPNYWYTNPLGAVNRLDWYNLYAVASQTDQDTTGGDPPVVTSYTYGPPGWHYDNDDVSRSAYPTWDEWRGFATITTETGTTPDPVTKTVGTYYQGLSNDFGAYQALNGGKEGNGVITLTTSRGINVTDDDQNAGEQLETRVFNGVSGSEVTDTEYNVPAYSAQTGAQTVNSALFLFRNAFLTDNGGENGGSQTDVWTDRASGADESVTSSTYDANGNPVGTDAKPWGAPETCTSTSYVTNTTSHLTAPKEVKVTAGSCASPGAVVTDTEYAYDGGAFGGIPTEGLVTGTEQIGAAASGATVVSGKTYDQYGRVRTATDGDQQTTTTAYTPATGAEPTSITVTDPMNLTTTTGYDPARDLPLTVTDPAGGTTTKAYDALGRVTAEWTPGNTTTGSPQVTHSYVVSRTEPAADVTNTQEPIGVYLTTEKLTDSLGREAEIQNETASGGTDITQTSYNSDGWKSFTSGAYYTASAPSATLVTADRSAVANETGYTYDGTGRETGQISLDDGTETWETDTTYGGNYTTVVPPAGGTSQTTFTNGLNQKTAIYQYHAGVPASPSDPPADYDQTAYTYTAAGKLASITDTATNSWTYTYDGLGDETSAHDPDTGTTTSTYDNAGQLVSATDARGKTTSYTYDTDGRKTAQYDTTGGAVETSGDQIAAWTWDTLANGKLTSATAFQGGAQYTKAITGYNTQGLASGTATVIPAAQGNLAGTYTQTYTYAPSGQETSYTDSAADGLPAETVTIGHDNAGDANALTGASNYVDSLSYTNLDQPMQYQMGTSDTPVYVTESYDPQTGNLTERNAQTGTAQTTVDDLHYAYDNVGDVTSEADTASGATDAQCYQYDYLGRLVQAWAQGTTGCAATPSAAVEGGVAPYWESYRYNTIGDLTGITATTPAGAVTTTTDTYPAAGTAQPHAVTGTSVASSTGTTTSTSTYDADGNLTTVTGSTQNQTLSWNDAGQLAQDALTPAGGSAQNTNYLYDADNTLLLTADPGTTTLYLADEQLSLNTNSGVVTGTRSYALDGTTVATRTNASNVAFVVGDQQGTDAIAIDATTLATTRRWYDPYGNSRGIPTAPFPDGRKGFVGGNADPATGMADLGAREYQPTTGAFISPDRILTPYVPQDLNPYAYAKDSPSTYSDPSGLYWVIVHRGSGITPWLGAAALHSRILDWILKNLVFFGIKTPIVSLYIYNPEARIAFTYAIWEWFTPDHKPTPTALLVAKGNIYARANWVAELELNFVFFSLRFKKEGITPAVLVGTCSLVAGVSVDPDKRVIARAILGCI